VPTDVPFGWQGSGQENAEDWDEDWDKFDDEGFSTVQGIMDEQ
jgi:epidermal growth factor receptor substrate 15